MRAGLYRMWCRGRGGFILLFTLLTLALLVTYYVWSMGHSSYTSRSAQMKRGQAYNQRLRQRPSFQQPHEDTKPFQDLNRQNIKVSTRPQTPVKVESSKEPVFLPHIPFPPVSDKKNDVKEDMYKDEEDIMIEEGLSPVTKKDDGMYMKPDTSYTEQFRKLINIVHLDLKGAAPSIKYLQQLLPLIARLGAKGILLEYEDMFPFSGNLSVIAAKNAYTLKDIETLNEAATKQNLQIIPLVQTFGHLEYVLKHEKFVELREKPRNPQVITPTKSESYELLQEMIDQVLKVHPDVHFLHIGSDEVWDLGSNGKSETLMKQESITKDELFLRHVKKVASYVQNKYPDVKPLMWDDELRYVSLEMLQNSGLGKLVEPMVWCYLTDINTRLESDIWKKYGLVFHNVWAASSFKGATGSSQFITDISHHLQNHFSWIHTIKKHSSEVHFRGVALTGWQRYDHFATLCELLPVSLPSLTVCLLTITNGGFDSDLHRMAGKMLNCSAPLELGLPAMENGTAKVTQDCAFPGSNLYYGVKQLYGIVHAYNSEGLQSRLKGWLTDYHVKRNISSPGQINNLNSKLSNLIQKLNGLKEPMKQNIENIFDKYTAEEWLEVNIVQRTREWTDKLRRGMQVVKANTWERRPWEAHKTTGLSQGSSSRQMGAAGFNQIMNRNQGLRQTGLNQVMNRNQIPVQAQFGQMLNQNQGKLNNADQGQKQLNFGSQRKQGQINGAVINGLSSSNQLKGQQIGANRMAYGQQSQDQRGSAQRNGAPLAVGQQPGVNEKSGLQMTLADNTLRQQNKAKYPQLLGQQDVARGQQLPRKQDVVGGQQLPQLNVAGGQQLPLQKVGAGGQQLPRQQDVAGGQLLPRQQDVAKGQQLPQQDVAGRQQLSRQQIAGGKQQVSDAQKDLVGRRAGLPQGSFVHDQNPNIPFQSGRKEGKLGNGPDPQKQLQVEKVKGLADKHEGTNEQIVQKNSISKHQNEDNRLSGGDQKKLADKGPEEWEDALKRHHPKIPLKSLKRN